MKSLRRALPLSILAIAVLQIGCREHQNTKLRTAVVAVKPLASHQRDPASAFPEKFPLQVAVLWTEPSQAGLGVEHSLRQMGIPFFWTSSVNQAVKHPLILLSPSVDIRTLTTDQVATLTKYVEAGGTVFASNVFAETLKPLFGFDDLTPSRSRHRVRFQAESDSLFKYLDRPEERTVPLGSDSIKEVIWTNGYTASPSAKVLATFEDGSAALLSNKLGKGTCYLAGVGLDDVVIRNQSNRDYEAQRHYVNAFEPGTDIWMLILRAWYESYAPNWVRLATIPAGKRSVLLLSHDIDSRASLPRTADFLAMEKRNGATSTLFVQTKYRDDGIGPMLMSAGNLDFLRKAKADGVDIESHSVTHAMNFNRFLLGSGDEQIGVYRARLIKKGKNYRDGTVFGEVRLSKEILDGEIPGQNTLFFRAGHLRVPPPLPEALERSGYLFDSSFTADDVMSNFPYALPLGLGMVEDTALYEFPVTFEDEEPPKLAGHVESDLDVIEANAANGAISVLLVHPADPEHNIPAEDAIIRRLPAGVVACDMLSFAGFWKARDHVRWTLTTENQLDVELDIETQEAVQGLTFEFQRLVEQAEGLPNLKTAGHRLILPALGAGQKAHVRVHCSKLPTPD